MIEVANYCRRILSMSSCGYTRICISVGWKIYWKISTPFCVVRVKVLFLWPSIWMLPDVNTKKENLKSFLCPPLVLEKTLRQFITRPANWYKYKFVQWEVFNFCNSFVQKLYKNVQKHAKLIQFHAINGKFPTTWCKFELLSYKLRRKYKNVQFCAKIIVSSQIGWWLCVPKFN